MSSTKATESERLLKEILEDFGKACAQRPINKEAIARCRKVVHDKGGDSLVLEGSAIVGAFSIVTRLADTTGRNMPKAGMAVASVVKGGISFFMKFSEKLADWYNWFQSFLPKCTK